MNRMFFWEDRKNNENLKNAFKRNWRLYLCEALGLAVFMISACFFSAMLEGPTSWHNAIVDPFIRTVIAGILMGATALFIFYSSFTSPSGSHINPAVTICFLRLKKINKADTFFYILFQITGGLLAVYLMAALIKKPLTSLPVNYVATVPLKGPAAAFATEFIIGFMMMSMVLFTSSSKKWGKYTRVFSGCLVCLYVIVAGPISGFGMNPARSLASAIPSKTWTSFWIYALVPFISMLLATEFFRYIGKKKLQAKYHQTLNHYLSEIESKTA